MAKKRGNNGKGHRQGELERNLQKIQNIPSRVYENEESIRALMSVLTHLVRGIETTGNSYLKTGTGVKIYTLIRTLWRRFRLDFNADAAKRLYDVVFELALINADRKNVLMAYNTMFSQWASQSVENVKFFYSTALKSLCRTEHPLSVDEIGGVTHVMNIIGQEYNLTDDPDGKGSPPMRSIELLYEAVADGDEEATAILRKLLAVFGHNRFYPVPAKIANRISVDDPSHKLHTLYFHSTDKAALGYLKLYNGIIGQLGIDDELKSIGKLVDEKFDDIAVLLEMLWTDIVEIGRCDVRTTGDDSFTITGCLGGLAGSKRYFIRNGYDYPEVGIVFVQPDWFSGMTYYETGKISPNLVDEDPAIGEYVRLADYLMNTIAYHRIVTKEPRKSKTDGTTAPATIITGLQVREMVREHLMALRPGWKPSPEKVEAYRLRGKYLPEGQTWVKESPRVRTITGSTKSQVDRTDSLFTIDPLRVLRNL